MAAKRGETGEYRARGWAERQQNNPYTCHYASSYFLSHRGYNACHRSHARSLVYTRIQAEIYFFKIIGKAAQTI